LVAAAATLTLRLSANTVTVRWRANAIKVMIAAISLRAGHPSHRHSDHHAPNTRGRSGAAEGRLASITGGAGNTALGQETSISGGGDNRAAADGSSILGGRNIVIRNNFETSP
jgi:hypothetical protein